MPIFWPLDKTITQGTTYEAPPDIGYVIEAIGTDATSDAKLVVDGRPTGAIISTIAPLHKTSSNLLGPLKLGELYYVIPPNRKFWVDGPSGAKLRLIGKIVKLIPGEAFPSDLIARFEEQHKKYITYKSDSYSVGTDTAWTADTEYTVLELTPKTIETYRFNNVVMAKVENASATITEGQVGVRFYLDGSPLDHLTSDPGMKGIDLKAMPYPPADTSEEAPFTLEKFPITVIGDHTLKITMINVSGSDISPTSGSSLVLSVLAIVEYEQK